MVHFKSCDSITLFIFVLRFPLKRLSIQYVYERVLLVFSFRLTHIVCLWKRVQKYNFFLISQVFWKVFLKIFILMFFSLIKRIVMRFYLLNISKNVAFLRVAKVQLLLYLASVSESFFENFCFHFSYRFTHSICLWTCSLSGWQR